MSDKPPHETLLERLIEASTFGLDDIEQNRLGKMSGLQRSRLALMTYLYFGLGALSFVFAGAALWIGAVLSQSLSFIVFLFLTMLGIYGCYYWLRLALPMWKDVHENTVVRISGLVHLLYTQLSGRPPTYFIHYKIANKFFDMAFLAPRLFPEGQTCHAYYTPKSEIIVGIEPTDAAQYRLQMERK